MIAIRNDAESAGPDTDRSPLFARLRSFEYKWGLCRERTERLKRVVAHDQLHAAALVESGTRRRAKRIGYWADQVQITEPLA
jgi:hypothetical protein